MTWLRGSGAALAAMALLMPVAGQSEPAAIPAAATTARAIVTVRTAGGATHRFDVELARTKLEQERGLMFRTNIPANGGMLFAPYPAEGAPPREASFWMHNTPSSLDILFVRPDGTIARIVANATPYSSTRILSGEPVNAVLEINAGRAAQLGIAAGDKLSWERVRN